ncbi:hypothetical protein V2J09_005325 [Rumex salicifolius]
MQKTGDIAHSDMSLASLVFHVNGMKMNLQLIRGDTIPSEATNGDLIKIRGLKASESELAIADQPDESIKDSLDITGCSLLYKQLQDKFPEFHYNWIIAYWMMEGYLGHIDSIEQAYHKGHDIFMELEYKRIPL